MVLLKAVLIGFSVATLAAGFLVSTALGAAKDFFEAGAAFFAAMVFFEVAMEFSTFD